MRRERDLSVIMTYNRTRNHHCPWLVCWLALIFRLALLLKCPGRCSLASWTGAKLDSLWSTHLPTVHDRGRACFVLVPSWMSWVRWIWSWRSALISKFRWPPTWNPRASALSKHLLASLRLLWTHHKQEAYFHFSLERQWLTPPIPLFRGQSFDSVRIARRQRQLSQARGHWHRVTCQTFCWSYRHFGSARAPSHRWICCLFFVWVSWQFQWPCSWSKMGQSTSSSENCSSSR